MKNICVFLIFCFIFSGCAKKIPSNYDRKGKSEFILNCIKFSDGSSKSIDVCKIKSDEIYG